MTCGVYCIKSPSGRCYVGSSQKMERRWVWHRHVLRRGKHHSPALQRAFKKYGEDAFLFSVLEECSIAELHDREQYWMLKMRAMGPRGYNVCPRAGSQRGYKHSSETKEKMRAAAVRASARDGESSRRSERAARQHGEKNLGAHTWRAGPDYATIAAKNRGRKASPGTCQKLKDAWTPERRAVHSERMRGGQAMRASAARHRRSADGGRDG